MFGRRALLACVCWIVLAPSAALAKLAPGPACQAAQLKAAGAFLAKSFKCWGAFHKNSASDPAPCLSKADAALLAAFDRALTRAGTGVCGLEDGPALLADLQVEVDTLSFAVSESNAGASKAEGALHAALQKAIGSSLGGALAAETRDAKAPNETKRLARRAKARGKLVAAFERALAKADAAGVTYAGLGAGAAADEVDRIADELAALTAPVGSAVYSLQGSLFAAAGSATDSDVNDPNTVPVSNDLAAAAQPLAVPSILGGYVNLPGAGPDGNSLLGGDSVDWFLVSLTAGQRVHLRLGASPQDADLDLCLYAAADPLTPLDCSLGLAETEELAAPSDGDFLVEVRAFVLCDCASTYVLTLGQTLAGAGAGGVRLSDDFRPGEAVVTLVPAALPAGPAPRAAAYESRFALQALGGAGDREMLFRLGEAAGARAASFRSLGALAAREDTQARFPGLSAERREKLDTILLLKALARRADVASAEPNWILQAQALPNDPLLGRQWHYPLLNLPGAWDVTTGSTSVKVAVIDTGVLLAHPDLQGQLAGGFDFISSSFVAADGDGIDANADDPGDGGGGPSSFHGTHVAGTIGARTDNASGVAGVAWDVTLVPLRVLGIGGGSNFDILQAVRYAAGLANDSGTSDKADVMNLSLGGGGFSSAAQSVFTQARNAGVIVIAAAGNSNSSQLFFPASYDGVVSVSAVDLRKAKAPYSNFGTAVDVAAPGGDTSVDRNGDGFVDGVLSTLKSEANGAFNFVFYQGTSMASPHVAGIAALMKAVKPALTPAELDALLAGGTITEDLGAAGRDDVFGHGLLDARKAVLAVSGPPPTNDPVLVLTPTGLNFGTSDTQATFQVANGGGGSLTVTSVSEGEPWLAVAPSDVDANGLGSYQVTVDRTALATGTFSAAIDVVTSAGNATVSVVMSVVAAASGADAGYHYVILVDPDTLDTISQAEAVPVDGVYSYQLDDVPAGSYLLYAGSDPDNDFLLCGGSEACGAFPTLGTPELLEVTGDRSGLDFVTGFQQTIGANAAGETPERVTLRRMRTRQLER
jgi:serine protease